MSDESYRDQPRPDCAKRRTRRTGRCCPEALATRAGHWRCADLLADLCISPTREGVDFRDELRMAETHFTAEVNGEP